MKIFNKLTCLLQHTTLNMVPRCRKGDIHLEHVCHFGVLYRIHTHFNDVFMGRPTYVVLGDGCPCQMWVHFWVHIQNPHENRGSNPKIHIKKIVGFGPKTQLPVQVQPLKGKFWAHHWLYSIHILSYLATIIHSKNRHIIQI